MTAGKRAEMTADRMAAKSAVQTANLLVESSVRTLADGKAASMVGPMVGKMAE